MRKVIISLNKKFTPNEAVIKKVLARLEKILDLQKTYLEVYLVNDNFTPHLSSAKNKTRKTQLKKGAGFTVHSFEPPRDFPRPDIKGYKNLGEIYLCPDFINNRLPRSARNDKLVFMLIHGLLHLLGYDHKKKSDRIKMETKEEELCRKIF